MQQSSSSSSLSARSSLEKALKDYIQNSTLKDWDAKSFLIGGSLQRGLLLKMIADSEGTDERVVELAAVGVELLHNASLVHDDIIDNDIQRRGQPSAYGAMGSNRALLFGDVLIAEAFACVAALDVSSSLRVRLVQIFSKVISDASVGQVVQLESMPSITCTLEACLDWSRQKTGLLFALPVEVSLTLAGKYDEAKLAKSAAVEIGMAYQIKDDMEDWLGRKKGRQTHSDAKSGQWTFAKIAQRDHPGAEVAAMSRWIQAAEERVESLTSLVSAHVRYSLACLRKELLHSNRLDDFRASASE